MSHNPSIRIPTAIVFAGIVVAFAVYLTVKPDFLSPSGYGNPNLVRPVSPDDHILGNPQATVTIVEYSDFDCDFCKNFSMTLHNIVNVYGASGKVAWVHRNYPITALHENAYKAAEAAECVAKAAGNTAYWQFADALYANQPTPPGRYLEIAQAAGASASAVGTCMQNASSTVDARIAADAANAADIGARGTPYSLILVAGKAPVVVDGEWPYDSLEQAIKDSLGE